MESQSLIRLQDWPLSLSDFLVQRADMPFMWGSNDCLMLAADAVLAITGSDLAADMRGTYATAEQAQEVLSQFGATVEDALDARLGSRKSVAYAQRGDIVTFESDGLICAGVVDDSGRRAALVSQVAGLVRVPLSRCLNAWSV